MPAVGDVLISPVFVLTSVKESVKVLEDIVALEWVPAEIVRLLPLTKFSAEVLGEIADV